MVRISPERTKELQKLLKEQTGKEYSDEEAQEAGLAIMRFVVAKGKVKTEARDKAMAKKQQAIANLRRMRYNGEADDDAWYFAEMKTLEDELENLQNDRNTAEHKARDWRAIADETFTFARYAKEDFDSDDLEKKRAVVVKLGEKLAIMERSIQFRPNKYFVPIEEMNASQQKYPPQGRTSLVRSTLTSFDEVRTDSQQGRIGTSNPISLSWLRGLDSNQRPSG